MFNVDFLNVLREAELGLVIAELRPGARILEFGAGTGEQAKALSMKGFDVVAIDLAQSAYSKAREFPIVDYDGQTIPLPDNSVDIIFSSNVLEHVENFPQIMSEFRRVLRNDGYCVHLIPSFEWRSWTFVTGIPTAFVAFFRLLTELIQPPASANRFNTAMRNLKTIAGALLPIGHGTSFEGISELWTFSVPSWRTKFQRYGFVLVRWQPLGLFHTGHMLLGDRLSIERRKKLSNRLGSAANVFVTRPV